MSSTAEQPDLIDPMCGTPVTSASPHRYAHGGVLFCFCSESCRERFMTNPSRFAVIAALEGAGRQLPPGAGADSQSAGQTSRFWSVPPVLAVADGGTGLADVIAGPWPGTVVRTEARGLFALVLAWRERRFAAARCREMMSLHGTVRSVYPELTGTALYRQILIGRGGSNPATVDEVLRNAEQSFAIWPVARELTFRDVVHYLAVSEFVSSYDGTPWVHVNMKRVVESMVPHDL
jgi:YHS domain-containing protein